MIAIVSSLVSKEIEEKLNIATIPLPSYSKLDMPVSTHADMLVSLIDDNIFVYEDYYLNNEKLFSRIKDDYKIVKIKKDCKKKYPDDIALNVLVMGKRIFARLDSIADEITSYAKKNGYKLINVSQGYSACSTLVISESSAITGDKGIYQALLYEGIRALLVNNNTIKLPGYNCGFIGGAGFLYDKKAIFFGEIEKHPDFQKIYDFLMEENITKISLFGGEVYDFGGVKMINI